MRPGDRVEDLELGEALGVLLAEHARRRARRSRWCRRRRRSRPAAPPPRSSARAARPSRSPCARGPRRSPFELQGIPQQLPATSSGIQTGSPARAETATSASTRVAGRRCDWCSSGRRRRRRRRCGWCRRGRRRRRRPRASVAGSFAGGRRRAAPCPRLVRRASGPPTRRPAREAPSTAPQRFAAASAARSARSACARLAQLLDQLAGVDPDRAGELAGAVGGAGLERRRTRTPPAAPAAPASPSGWRAISRRRTIRCRGVVVRLRLGQTGSQKPHSTQVVADSSIGGVVFRLRRWTPGSRLRTTPGREHAVGVGELLHPPHQLGRLLPPLALDVRGHVDPGAVLGLQRAVVLVDDQLDQAAHEGLVALEVLLLGEVRGQHEVEVAGRGVAGDAGQEAVLAEQRLQVAGALGDPLRRHADVLDDQRRARQAQPADQPVQALAHPPGELDLLRLAGEVDRADRLVGGEDLARPRRRSASSSRLVGGAELDQQHRRLRRQLLPLLAARRPCSRRR